MYTWGTPPKFLHQCVDLLAQGLRKQEDTHAIGRDCLHYRLEQNFPPRLREKFEFPILELFPNFINNAFKFFSTRFPYQSWQA
jgi:hypothetical protein